MQVEHLEAFLRGCSCFALLSDDELERLRARSRMRHYGLGEVVFRQGEPGDGMYVVYSGKVRVLREDDGRDVPLNTLYASEHFGELSLVNRQPRNATIRAAADSTLVAVPADALTELLERNADLRRYFERYAERIELWNFVKLVGRVGPQLKAPQLRRLVDQFQERTFAAGETVLAEGDVPAEFHLVQSGRVKVLRGERVHATLTSGDTFGGGSLIEVPPGRSRFTIRADGPLQTVALAAEEFRRLLDEAPGLRSFFEEQLAHYSADLAAGHFAAMAPRPSEGDGEPLAVEGQPREFPDETGPGSAPFGGPARSLAGDTGTAAVAVAAPSAVEIPSAGPATAEPAASDEAAPARGPRGFWARSRFPFIPQHEQVDCGVACLSMITAWHGRGVGVSRLRDLAGVTTEGSSLTQLAHAAEEVGYETRALRLSPDGLDRLRLPAVLFWKGYHYVVLYALTDRYAYIADPAFGKQRITRAQLEEQYSGYALEVAPTAAAAAVRPRKGAVRRVWDLLLQHKKVLGAILAASAILELFGLAPAIFTKYIVDDVLNEGIAGAITAYDARLSTLNLVAMGLLLVSTMEIGTTLLRARMAVRLSQRLDRSLLREFYTHLLSLPTRFFKLRRTGDIFARFDDNRYVRELFTAGTMTVVLDSLSVVVYFALMFYWNVPLALVVLAFVPVLAGFTLLVSPVMKRQVRQVLEDEAGHESNLIESIGGIDMVKAMAVEDPVRRKWEHLHEKFLTSQLRSERLDQTFSAISRALGVLSTVALLWYGAYLVLNNQLQVGEFMAFSILAGQVTGPLMGVIGIWDQLQQARVSLERMGDVLDNDPERQPDPDERIYPEVIRGRVRFERVFFDYGGKGARPILQNVSFVAEPGQRIAIVGRSGSGKTTLARLLLGLYRPTEGRIAIDGWDLERIDLATYRRQIGFVLQENLLFSGTIRENVALGHPKPDQQRVEEAATLAGAHEFITEMPLGYDTVVGELGLTLSGGQRQRISIARALYRNPRILVLDEATSALDSLSEREIQKNLGAILADRTAFIIAHKISTVRDADLILVLHDGTIVEQGTHDELIARRGTYYFLAAQQLNL